MTDAQLVKELLESTTPRPEPLARATAAKLFPLWQMVLVGAPIGLIAAAMLGLATTLVVALPLGQFVGYQRPAWFGHLSEVTLIVGAGIGVWLVVWWMRRRRAHFAALARNGVLLPAHDRDADGLAGALGSSVGATLAKVALGGLGGTLVQVYGGPIAVAKLDGTVIEARTVANSRGQFRVPELMLADATGGYVALMHRSGWIAAQRVLRRRPG